MLIQIPVVLLFVNKALSNPTFLVSFVFYSPSQMIKLHDKEISVPTSNRVRHEISKNKLKKILYSRVYPCLFCLCT